MHLLSSRNRDEFLANPALVRFVLADEMGKPQPTLLIKASTLSLKYLIRSNSLRLLFFRVRENFVGYGVQLDKDPDHSGIVWSIFEYTDEVIGALGLINNSKCTVFLFNELAVNVAWCDATVDLSGKIIADLLNKLNLHPLEDILNIDEDVTKSLSQFHGNTPTSDLIFDCPIVSAWNAIRSHYITNRIETSLISIFEKDEGRQQEEIAHWLVDNLHPIGAVRSPQIYEESKVRELSDIFLNYENGCFLIESKTLSIFVRDELPSRKKLADAVTKHIGKAIRQLTGAVKNLQRGLRVTDEHGKSIDIKKSHFPHIIILVPDLNLLWNAQELNGIFFMKVCADANSHFHILDPAELLRIVQAANMISDSSKSITPIMAFDYYLIERSETSWKQSTPNFGALLRIENNN